MATKVTFKKFQGEILAIFPTELYNSRLYGKTMLVCYAHMGQHSGCSNTLLKCKNAKKSEYQPLLNELISIGYDDLKVTNKE